MTEQSFFPTKEQLRELEKEWDANELTTVELAKKYGTTKNAIIGIARRRFWASRWKSKSVPPPRTMQDRLDALHAKFDKVLEETARV